MATNATSLAENQEAVHRLGLTKKQLNVLNFIKAYSFEMGCAPSLDDIATAMNLKSRSAAHAYVSRLVERGYVRRKYNASRSIMVVSDGP